METLLSANIQNLFEFYKASAFSISNDFQFWKNFLDRSIDGYKNEDKERRLFESGFCVYDLSHNSLNGYLKSDRKIFDVSIENLDTYRKSFFSWIMNLAILKAYNSCELLLLRAIQLKFYPTLNNPLEGKKYADGVQAEIKQALIKPDTKNNGHLIEFLQQKSILFNEFSSQKIRLDWETSWTQFFEFVSILRNVIAHHGGIVHRDTLNNIKSLSKKYFEAFFEVNSHDTGYDILQPKEGDYFLNFMNHIDDFSVNTMKFIFEEKDLSFIEMH